MNAALETHFRRPALPRLLHAARDFLEREVVRAAAQVVVQLAFGKGAEAACVAADVGVVDVAVDDVGDDVAVRLRAQRIGGGADFVDLGSARRKQPHDGVRRQALVPDRPVRDRPGEPLDDGPLVTAADEMERRLRHAGRRDRPCLGEAVHVLVPLEHAYEERTRR